MHKVLILGALPVLALAAQTHPSYLFRRTDDGNYVEIGYNTCRERNLEPCGNGCIALGSTCCEDLKGGCLATQYCTPGDNGEYGCCDIGEICSGDGGATTSTITLTPTSTSAPDDGSNTSSEPASSPETTPTSSDNVAPTSVTTDAAEASPTESNDTSGPTSNEPEPTPTSTAGDNDHNSTGTTSPTETPTGTPASITTITNSETTSASYQPSTGGTESPWLSSEISPTTTGTNPPVGFPTSTAALSSSPSSNPSDNQTTSYATYTSTIYSTILITVTSCAPTLTSCPSYATRIIPVSTTVVVCPVTGTSSGTGTLEGAAAPTKQPIKPAIKPTYLCGGDGEHCPSVGVTTKTTIIRGQVGGETARTGTASVAPSGYTGVYNPTGRLVFSGAAGGFAKGGRGLVWKGMIQAVGVLGVLYFVNTV